MSASQHPPAADVEIIDPVLGRRRATPARLRARSLAAPKLSTVEEREDYIELLFLEGIWTDHTSRECQFVCAEAWGLSMSTVRDYSAAASRKHHARAREDGGRYAALALRTMAEVATFGAGSDVPGDKSAAVNAAKELLKFAGLAEPEEDKQRGSTVQVIGTVITSPAMQALVGPAKQLNGGSNGHTNGRSAAEAANELPALAGFGPLVQRRGDKS